VTLGVRTSDLPQGLPGFGFVVPAVDRRDILACTFSSRKWPGRAPGGECCTDHGGPGCDDSTCQACVCDVDDACCNNVWDADCVSEARVECALACPCATEGDCCAAHDGIGCEDAECKNCVCGLDAACCTDGQGWDADCVDEATVECAASCTCEVAGSCCEDHIDTVGCDDRPCQACVCDADPPCCTDGWDPQCADEAATNCSERCVASNCKASCCETHDQPGCVDATCQTCVCNEDDFCCSDNGGVWDQGCLEIAMGTCGASCQCSGGSCAGDCDGGGSVQINELVKCVNIALGSAESDSCPACDANGMNGVEISELVRAVNASLSGCP
jgi:hypothetical protein